MEGREQTGARIEEWLRAHGVERHVQQGGRLVLQVRDDGRGITQDQIDDPRSLGLLGIRERARRLGGSVSFGRVEPKGTVVRFEVPLPAG